jgi:hypothetical protein
VRLLARKGNIDEKVAVDIGREPPRPRSPLSVALAGTRSLALRRNPDSLPYSFSLGAPYSFSLGTP